jgi:hypothetical protein
MKRSDEQEITRPMELYGELMQRLHISREEKNLEYFANEIFKAAGEDIQRGRDREDKLANRESFDKAIDSFLDKLKLDKNQGEDFRKELADKLTPKYNQLKEVLKEVRVLGVGKNLGEKAYTLMGMAYRTGATITGIALGIASFALSVEASRNRNAGVRDAFSGDIRGAASHLYVGNVEKKMARSAAMDAGTLLEQGVEKTDKLMSIRAEMKNIMKGDNSDFLPIAGQNVEELFARKQDKTISNVTKEKLKTERFYKGNSSKGR